MCEMSTREAFASIEDLEEAEREVRKRASLDRESNLRAMAAKCAAIAEQYGGTEVVAVGALSVKIADLVNHKVTFTCEEPVFTSDFRGERTLRGCWIAAGSVDGVLRICDSFLMQYLGVVDRKTLQILALHSLVLSE